MSKKDRLRKQSQKQLEEKKKQKQQEEQEKKEAPAESRSAKKLRRQAKRHDSALSLIVKFLMLLPFLWSGFYYGGIFIIGITMEQMDEMPRYVALLLGIGEIFFIAAIILAFISKYIAQFVSVLVGTAFFMTAAVKIINKAKERVGAGYGLTDDQRELPSKWSWGLYPILFFTAFSALLFVIWLVGVLSVRRRRQRERDNAPVKSIVED